MADQRNGGKEMDEDISPDVIPESQRPSDPAEAVRREREKYGEGSINPNRDDQWDEHHGQPEDIV
ncbi:MAG TPA: hypothetical protein VGG51_10720 [Candidatus Cybelea sp.]|jgi:hypothetical protein